MMKEKVLLFCALLANWAMVIGLKLKSVSIPQYVLRDSQVTLGCYFDLERDQLLVLKWYKDGHEFFRYSIQTAFPILTFPTEGVWVEISQSNMNQVVLKNVSLRTSGTYKCEVSADRPSFRTLSQPGLLTVIVPPKGLPHMECLPASISIGDMVNCNCSSYASKPAASLMFYLNEAKANFGDMIEYLPSPESQGLETSTLGLIFQTEATHLRNRSLDIKCTATIGTDYWKTNLTLVESPTINVNAQPSAPGHNRWLSSGGSRGNEARLLNPLTLLGLEIFTMLPLLFLHLSL